MKQITRILFLALLFGIYDCAYAQTNQETTAATELIAKGDRIMATTRNEIEAQAAYEEAAKLDPSNIKANYLAGYYKLIGIKRTKSVQYLEKVKSLDPDYRFDIDFLIGHGYHYNMDFDKAIEHYELYKKRLASKPDYRGEGYVPATDVNVRIRECKTGKTLVANPNKQEITNLGPSVNSQYDDFAPVFNQDESIIIFTSRRWKGNINDEIDDDNMPYEDIFYAYKNGEGWDSAENIGDNINGPFHDSNLAMTPDGNHLYIYKEVGNGDIYLTNHDPETDLWEDPVDVGTIINTEEFTENSLTFADGGNLMVFASNRFGGYGDFDLYYTSKDANGVWQPPTNMGGVINTRSVEDGPFLDHDGKTLFFSSEGHDGMGGFDIYKTVYDSASNQWSPPVNLGYPINTPDNDIFYISSKDNKEAFYASIKDEGYGFLDIYKIVEEEIEEEKEPVVVEEEEVFPVDVVFRIIDRASGDILDAVVNLSKTSDKSPVVLDRQGPGVYTTVLENKETESYVLETEMPGYIFETRALEIPGMREEGYKYQRNIAMQKLVVNVRRVLRNIYFQFDKAIFLEESYDELDKLLKMMNDNPSLTVEIGGHTDNVGDDAYNKKLSQERADAVRSYLIEKGVTANRVTAMGYGEEQPLATNDDEVEGRELNRRVEFKVTGN